MNQDQFKKCIVQSKALPFYLKNGNFLKENQLNNLTISSYKIEAKRHSKQNFHKPILIKNAI